MAFHGRSNSDSSSRAPMTTSYAARPRKRTAHACDACRLRKSRCDGRQPCSWCTENEVECLYGQSTQSSAGVNLGKSDKILETVLRMDGLLRSIHENLSEQQNIRSISSPTFSDSSTSDQDFSKVANATLSAHTSATEDLLSSPYAAPFPSLRSQFRPIFQLESTRDPLPFSPRSIRPCFTIEETERLLGSFQNNVNFWYPTVSKTTIEVLFESARNGFVGNSCVECAALLVVGLGAASEYINLVNSGAENSGFETRRHQSELMSMGSVCFDEAMKLLTVAYMEVSTLATQCLFLTALYCSFIQRPLQTWSYLSTAATKCRALLAYGTYSHNSEDDECIRRIFWSCYIIESDLISELSHLPQSGVASIESSVPLPGPLQTHFNSTTTESSALYFLSCISIRRLLNRVHHLLYAEDPSKNKAIQTKPPDDSLRNLIAELDRQLDLWRETLPEFLKFGDEIGECVNEHAAFLRQRYLACRSVIYRPYVEIVLKGNGIVHCHETVDAAGKCLIASCLHIMNLRSFNQTVLVDAWICSLSMTSTMFILLVSLQNASLRPILLQHTIPEFGAHLRQLLSSWVGNMRSPSIQQGIRMIAEIENLIRDTGCFNH